MGFFPYKGNQELQSSELLGPELNFRGYVVPNMLFRIIEEINMTKRFPMRKLILPVSDIIKYDNTNRISVEEYGDGQFVIGDPLQDVQTFISRTESTIRFNPKVSDRPEMRDMSPNIYINTRGLLSSTAGRELVSHMFTIETVSPLDQPNPHMYPISSELLS